MDFASAFEQLKQRVSAVFASPVDGVVVADLSSRVKFLHARLQPEFRVTALKILEGNDVKPEDACLALQSFVRENNLSCRNLVYSPPLSALALRRVQLPDVPGQELGQAVKWQIKSDLPFDIEKAVFGYTIIQETLKEDGAKMLDIGAVAAPEQEITKQVLAFKDAGFNCLAVTPVIFGYAAIAACCLSAAGNPGIVFLGKDDCQIAVFKGGEFSFRRELPFSLEKLKESLRAEVASDKGRAQLSPEEAEEFLFQHGVPQAEFIFKDKISSGQLMAMLRPHLERLAQEIKRSLAYYDTQYGGGKVNAILLADEALRLPSLDKFLSAELALEASFLSLAGKVSAAEKIPPLELARCAATAGLARGFGKGINLLPFEFRAEKMERAEKLILRWAAFAAVLLLLVPYLFGWAMVSVNERKLNNTMAHLNVLSEVKSIKARLDALNNFISEVRQTEPSAGAMLKILSRICPREVFLSELQVSCDTESGVLSGAVKAKDAAPETFLSKFANDMSSCGYFRDVVVSSVEKQGAEEASASNFKINFKLK
jgi:type IV pilus assembly protein PilM